MASPYAIPEGYTGNPFVYLKGVAAKIIAPSTPTPGFRWRLVALMCLMIYVILVSFVHFGITSLDYQRKGRSWWIFRKISRPSGKFIVSNQQFFAPLLSAICAVTFLAHLVSEYLVFFTKRGDFASNTVLRVIPWTCVFLHSWIISWASLQAFLLTSRREGIMSARVANWTFLGLGGLGLSVLLAFDIIEIYGLVRFWRKFDVVCALLDDYAPLYGPDIDTSPQLWLAQAHFQQLLDEWAIMIKYTYGLLSVFAVTPFLTSLVNLGSLGLVIILRRQINFNFKSIRATSRFDTRAGEDRRTDPPRDDVGSTDGDIEEESMVMNELAYIPQEHSSVSSKMMETGESQNKSLSSSKDGSVAPPPATGFAARVRQLTFTVRPSPRTVTSVPIRSVNGTTNEAYSEKFSAVEVSEKTLSEDLVVREDGRYRVKLSRSRIRRMAKNQRHSLSFDGEALKHLNDLLRAERDLIVTGTNIFVLSIAFCILSIWICINLESFGRSWVPLEISLLLGTYLYGVVVSIALSINCFTAYRHLTTPEPKSRPPRTVAPSFQVPLPSAMLARSTRSSEEVQVDSPAMIGFLISPTVPPKAATRIPRLDHPDFFPSSGKQILSHRAAARRMSEASRFSERVVEGASAKNDGSDLAQESGDATIADTMSDGDVIVAKRDGEVEDEIVETKN